MPYGTDSFTDRYGDYKQPTVIDYDKNLENLNYAGIPNLSVEESLKIHSDDIESTLKEILEFNPYFAGDRYRNFISSQDSKLVWNIPKINEMKSNSNWLFTLRKYLNKAKKEFNIKK